MQAMMLSDKTTISWELYSASSEANSEQQSCHQICGEGIPCILESSGDAFEVPGAFTGHIFALPILTHSL
jgi:hypothetical protein